MTKMRTLNDAGLLRFKEYIAAAKTSPRLDPPRELLEDGRFSEPFAPSLVVELQDFENAYDFGVYLNSLFADLEPRAISRNHALWSWLALFFFDQLTKSATSGVRKILEDAVYILDARFSFQRYYRHLVRTPWLAVNKHGEVAKVLLIAAAGGTRTEVGEQLGAYPDIFGNVHIIAVAYSLYFDVSAQKPKRGTSGKTGGTPRRLTAVVRQLQLTYDLNDCPVNEILGLLPKEFSRWQLSV